jgi:hypothetical protein
MKNDRFSFVTCGNVSPSVSRAQNHGISRGISIHVRKRFKRVWATKVSKHVASDRTRQIARNRCHSLFSYVISTAMNMSLDQRLDTRDRDWEPQSGQRRSR